MLVTSADISTDAFLQPVNLFQTFFDSHLPERGTSSQIEGQIIPSEILDAREATTIARLFFRAYSNTIHALKKKNFSQFDAVIGDHNCHVIALIASFYANFESYIPKEIPKQIEIKPENGKSTYDLIKERGFGVPSYISFLVSSHILYMGSTCQLNRDGAHVLSIQPQMIAEKVKGDRKVIEKLMTPLRERVNQFSIDFQQKVLASQLKENEREFLFQIEEKRTHRGELFKFINPYFSVKATIQAFTKFGGYFVLVDYHVKKQIKKDRMLVFNSEGKPIENSDQHRPLFVIQGFFEDKEEIVKYGLFNFLLDSIATFPQREGSSTENDEDLKTLPQEIKVARERGKKFIEQNKVIHTYADSYQNLRFC